MKLRYYGKGRNFNSIGCVKKRENSDRKNSYFFNLCSADFTMIVFFALVIAPQSISSQCFKIMEKLLSSLVEHWVEIDETHSKGNSLQQNMVAFSFKNRLEQLTWQKIIISSCNKTFKQVLFFL